MNAAAARVLAAVAVAAAAAVLAGPEPVAVTGGLLLALVLPGLAVTAVLFRGRTLTAVERTVLAPGLSLAVLVVAGLVMYVSGFALDRYAWTAATTAVALAALVPVAVPLPRAGAAKAALVTEMEIAELAAAAKLATVGIGEQRVRIRALPRLLPEPKPPLRRIGRQLIPMVLVLAVLTGAGWLSFVSSRHAYDVTVTALSATPPGALDAAGHRTVGVTATGLIAADGPYRLAVVGSAGTETDRRTVTADPGGTWTATLSVGGARCTINLYRAGDTTAYRTVSIAAAE